MVTNTHLQLFLDLSSGIVWDSIKLWLHEKVHGTFVSDTADEPVPNASGFITACQPFLSPHTGATANFFNKHLHTDAYSNGLIPSTVALLLHVYPTIATHEWDMQVESQAERLQLMLMLCKVDSEAWLSLEAIPHKLLALTSLQQTCSERVHNSLPWQQQRVSISVTFPVTLTTQKYFGPFLLCLWF